MITMTLRDGTRYSLDDEGRVQDRSDGPRGWSYSGNWIIAGFLKRHNSRLDKLITLEDAIDGADTGQGWVVDIDHGTVRLWGSPSGHKLATIRREN